MTKIKKSFSVDSDIVEAIRPLATTYGVNLSQIVNDSLFLVLQQLRAVDKLVSENPEGVPFDVARASLKQLISQTSGDTQSLLDEHFPELTKKNTKVKA
jgi:hypothetical protein